MSVLPSGSSVDPFATAAVALPDSADLGGVVEIGLLLPTDWAMTLVELSKKRQQSVAQMLRAAIERTFIQTELSS